MTLQLLSDPLFVPSGSAMDDSYAALNLGNRCNTLIPYFQTNQKLGLINITSFNYLLSLDFFKRKTQITDTMAVGHLLHFKFMNQLKQCDIDHSNHIIGNFKNLGKVGLYLSSSESHYSVVIQTRCQIKASESFLILV